MTLIKLRRNLAMEDLAYRFDTSISQVTKIFHRWLEALHVSVGVAGFVAGDRDHGITRVFSE